jgi:hypothetical protein
MFGFQGVGPPLALFLGTVRVLRGLKGDSSAFHKIHSGRLGKSGGCSEVKRLLHTIYNVASDKKAQEILRNPPLLLRQ